MAKLIIRNTELLKTRLGILLLCIKKPKWPECLGSPRRKTVTLPSKQRNCWRNGGMKLKRWISLRGRTTPPRTTILLTWAPMNHFDLFFLGLNLFRSLKSRFSFRITRQNSVSKKNTLFVNNKLGRFRWLPQRRRASHVLIGLAPHPVQNCFASTINCVTAFILLNSTVAMITLHFRLTGTQAIYAKANPDICVCQNAGKDCTAYLCQHEYKQG